MAAEDDEFEYVKGTFKYRKGTTPDQSREDPEAWRATLRDEGGHLSGQAEFIPSTMMRMTTITTRPQRRLMTTNTHPCRRGGRGFHRSHK